MDKNAFIGFGASLVLRDGTLVRGRIRDVDPTAHTLHLDDVNIQPTGFYVGPYTFKGCDILDLSMFHIDSEDSPSPSRTEPELSRPNTAPLQHKKKLPTRKTTRKPQNLDLEQWAQDDVENILKGPDFDFEGNLELFDKQKVFNDIREFDDSNPQLRLVTTNKRLKNVPHGESVLTPSRAHSTRAAPLENTQRPAKPPRRSNSLSSITDTFSRHLTLSPRPRRRDKPRRKKKDDDTAPEFLEREFDFQAASQRFDKKRIFEDIARR